MIYNIPYRTEYLKIKISSRTKDFFLLNDIINPYIDLEHTVTFAHNVVILYI